MKSLHEMWSEFTARVAGRDGEPRRSVELTFLAGVTAALSQMAYIGSLPAEEQADAFHKMRTDVDEWMERIKAPIPEPEPEEESAAEDFGDLPSAMPVALKRLTMRMDPVVSAVREMLAVACGKQVEFALAVFDDGGASFAASCKDPEQTRELLQVAVGLMSDALQSEEAAPLSQHLH